MWKREEGGRRSKNAGKRGRRLRKGKLNRRELGQAQTEGIEER